MTQEFVAEAIGVSRQAVSKWESGASDPSTSNLLALAKLYGVSGRRPAAGSGGGMNVSNAFPYEGKAARRSRDG